MSSEAQKRRFQELRTLASEQKMTDAERSELATLTSKREAEEANYLRPATQLLEQRNQALAQQNQALRELVSREKRLNRYLKRVLQRPE